VEDLIAEWTDESKPTPFVMRRELVPGTYGRFSVSEDKASQWERLQIVFDDGDFAYADLTADELDEAAHLFTQLAEYLREKK